MSDLAAAHANYLYLHHASVAATEVLKILKAGMLLPGVPIRAAEAADELGRLRQDNFPNE